MPRGVQVVAIEPQLGAEGQLRVRMDVESSRRDAIIELVRRMEMSPHFQHAQIRDEGADSENSTFLAQIESYYLVSGKAAR
jgi:hypothetical protein